jgi:hypothetical protein
LKFESVAGVKFINGCPDVTTTIGLFVDHYSKVCTTINEEREKSLHEEYIRQRDLYRGALLTDVMSFDTELVDVISVV